ncbi:MAG: phosphoserine phosphatase [Candidatus Omnitrophica bacterium CG1_02_46_14]|nr:MAG: phosphoserine phosphatase [Candidatus Omnitrophica bacterium CG1_02_46_14]
MAICCLDLEGVLVPEIWIKVSEKTKIKDLRLTTRDIPDYDALMKRRLAILRQNKIKLRDIQKVIASIQPLPGANAFLDKLRSLRQVIILSDTYYEFAMPLMKKLAFPTLFCNRLETDKDGFISRYLLRQTTGKEKAVQGLKTMNFRVHAAGDSYNDIAMLKAADKGVLFDPPPNIVKEFPQFSAAKNYKELAKFLLS